MGFHTIITMHSIYHTINLTFEIKHLEPKTWDYQLHHPTLIIFSLGHN